MSNLSLKAALREDKFNVKTIAVILILIDISLFSFFFDFNMLSEFFYLVLYQASIILALLFGLRGQGRYKSMMIQLQSIARNRDLDIDERDNRLVSMIHHACLELGYIYEERNKEYGLFTKKIEKVPKKTKNLEVKRRLIFDEVVYKQIGYMIVGIWGFLGVALLELLVNWLNVAPLWIIAIEGMWYVFDAFILFYIHYIFRIEPKKTLTVDDKVDIPENPGVVEFAEATT